MSRTLNDPLGRKLAAAGVVGRWFGSAGRRCRAPEAEPVAASRSPRRPGAAANLKLSPVVCRTGAWCTIRSMTAGGGRRIEEDLGPARERQIRRHHGAPALVALADEAEQQG